MLVKNNSSHPHSETVWSIESESKNDLLELQTDNMIPTCACMGTNFKTRPYSIQWNSVKQSSSKRLEDQIYGYQM